MDTPPDLPDMRALIWGCGEGSAVCGGGAFRRRIYSEEKTVTGSLVSLVPEHFQFETLRVPNHTACRFAEKTRFFRSLLAGRRCAAASHFAFFKGKML